MSKTILVPPRTFQVADAINPTVQIQALESVRAGFGFDLRKTINEILDKWGHNVLIRKNQKHFRCKCFDPHTQESGIASCATCDGTGYVPLIEKVLTRRWGLGDNNPDRLMPESKVAQSTRIFYFKHWVHPKVGDLIYEVTWVPNAESGRPKQILHEYSIDKAHEARADRGRIEYYRCECREEFLLRAVRTINLRKVRGIINYEIEWKERGK